MSEDVKPAEPVMVLVDKSLLLEVALLLGADLERKVDGMSVRLAAAAAKPASVEYVDDWGCKHAVTIDGAAEELRVFENRWPGGLEEIESSITQLSGNLAAARRLVTKLWHDQPETRAAIEAGTGRWFVLGVDRDAPVQGIGE